MVDFRRGSLIIAAAISVFGWGAIELVVVAYMASFQGVFQKGRPSKHPRHDCVGRATIAEWPNRFPGLNPTRGLPAPAATSSQVGQHAGSVCRNHILKLQRCPVLWTHSHPNSRCLIHFLCSLPLTGVDTHHPRSWPWWTPLAAGTTGTTILAHPWDTKHPPRKALLMLSIMSSSNPLFI